ncbi:MAG: hypothetical protein AMXMBFR84_27170 [Candidatus Hydrogenedentota bacterium]
MARKKTVLVVVAHADDMEFLAGGTVARFVDERGYALYEYILTDNAKGSHRLTADEVKALSAREAVEAGQYLGLKSVRFGEYEDGELNQENPNVLRGKVMDYIREIRADIVMSWDPFAPFEEHPDHRVTGMAALEAASFSGNPKFHPESNYDPYPVTEAYWFAKHPRDASLFVEITRTFEKKVAALLMHRCQMDLMIDHLIQEASILGIDVPVLQKDSWEEHQRIIRSNLHSYFAAVGQRAGYPLAEQFRYQKLGHLDAVVSGRYLEPDFQ